MPEFINNNSALILAFVLLLTVGWFIWDYRRNKKVLMAIIAIVLVLGAGYAQTRHGPSDVDSVEAFDALLAQGTPIVLEIYSDTCVVCLASKPAVDGLERNLGDRAQVVQMSIDEPSGRAIARRYQASVTPTFVVLSADGVELHRQQGYPNVDELAAEALAAVH